MRKGVSVGEGGSMLVRVGEGGNYLEGQERVGEDWGS